MIQFMVGRFKGENIMTEDMVEHRCLFHAGWGAEHRETASGRKGAGIRYVPKVMLHDPFRHTQK